MENNSHLSDQNDWKTYSKSQEQWETAAYQSFHRSRWGRGVSVAHFELLLLLAHWSVYPQCCAHCLWRALSWRSWAVCGMFTSCRWRSTCQKFCCWIRIQNVSRGDYFSVKADGLKLVEWYLSWYCFDKALLGYRYLSDKEINCSNKG